jgi:ribosomal-protein-serine acetyltransferase
MIPEELDAGGGLVLRKYKLEDAEPLGEAVTASVEHLRPFMPWANNEPVPIEDRRELVTRWRDAWGSEGDLVFAMYLGEAFIGGCGLHRRRGPHGLEIGYWVHVDYVGRGYATDASRALTSAAFTLPEIDFVEIRHDVNNTASGRIPAKLGYELVEEVESQRDAPASGGRDVVWRITRDAWDR